MRKNDKCVEKKRCKIGGGTFVPDVGFTACEGINRLYELPCCGFKAHDIKEEVPDYLDQKLGMYSYFAPAREVGIYGFGNALLSKYPIKNPKTVMIPDVDSENEKCCVLVAEIDVCGGIKVLVTHFGLSKAEHEQGVKTDLSLIDEGKMPIVLWEI